jgi:hypothetical protein
MPTITRATRSGRVGSVGGVAPSPTIYMAAVAAGSWSRGQRQHQLAAAKNYSIALRGLSNTLHDMMIAKSDATLGTCLLLCIYEVGFFSA